jgi:hypothetical protein
MSKLLCRRLCTAARDLFCKRLSPHCPDKQLSAGLRLDLAEQLRGAVVGIRYITQIEDDFPIRQTWGCLLPDTA